MGKCLRRLAGRYSLLCSLAGCLVAMRTAGARAAELPSPSEMGAEGFVCPYDRTYEREVRRKVPGWIRDLDSPDPVLQESAIRMLLGETRIAPSRKTVRVLTDRGISYDSWESRTSALDGLGYKLMERPEKLIPLIRDGMNDPHPRVRASAIMNLSLLLTYPTLELAESYREEVLDLLITKGLTDENEEVATAAFNDLEVQHIAPTRAALRALDRVIATKRAHKSIRGYLPETRADWARKLPPPQPPAAPKPRRAKPAPPPQVPRFPLPVG